MKKDLLKMMDLSRDDITRILDMADQMKYNQHHGLPHRFLEGKTVVMIFEKNSTRTRVSFEAGIYQLGGHGIYLSGKESQIVRGEPPEDTARTLARYADALVIRTYSQKEVETLAQYAEIPVINGMTDYAHPCQVLADLMTIRERMTRLEGLNLCYIGDGNNMCNSLIVGGLKCGLNVSVACPEGYEPDPQVLEFAHSVTDATFTFTRDPLEAAKDADVIFTDVWISMGMEAETETRIKAFQGYQVNDAVVAVAKPGCMVQHCLPAHRGQEITGELLEAHADEIFDEAENRLHTQKAVLYLLMGGGEEY
jgi:ornithine carbamoyltransferase